MTLVAVLAGCNSIHTTSYDEAYTIPTEEAVRTALRTQQIIAYETDAASTVDPMGGSYLLEHLTSKIEEDIEKEMDRIKKEGGILKNIENGSIQRAGEVIYFRYHKKAYKLAGGALTPIGLEFQSELDSYTVYDTTYISAKNWYVMTNTSGTDMLVYDEKFGTFYKFNNTFFLMNFLYLLKQPLDSF